MIQTDANPLRREPEGASPDLWEPRGTEGGETEHQDPNTT